MYVKYYHYNPYFLEENDNTTDNMTYGSFKTVKNK